MQPADRLALAIAADVAQRRAQAALVRGQALDRCDRSAWQPNDYAAAAVAHREAAAHAVRAARARSALMAAWGASCVQTLLKWLGCDPATYARAVAEVLAEEQSLC